MEFQCYPHMSWQSRHRFLARKCRYGKEVPYKPPALLVKNLSQKLGLSKTQVYNQLIKERRYLLNELNLT